MNRKRDNKGFSSNYIQIPDKINIDNKELSEKRHNVYDILFFVRVYSNNR